MMTEEEARKKWCPYASISMSESRAIAMPRPTKVERDDGGDVTGVTITCIGSACMAWRVAQEGFKRERTDAAIEQRFRSEYGNRLTIEERNWPSSGYDTLVVHAAGYCGAFGR